MAKLPRKLTTEAQTPKGIVTAATPETAIKKLAQEKKRYRLGELMRWRRTCKYRKGEPIRDNSVPWFYQSPPARLSANPK